MKILSLSSICLLVLVFCSCKNTDKKTESSEKKETTTPATNTLAGQVYSFAPDIDTTQCQSLAECDCCADDILFQNEKEFISISYCMAAKDIKKGTYILEQNRLILKYDTLAHYTEEDDDGELKTIGKDKKTYLIKTEVRKPFIDTLILKSCKGKTYYTDSKQENFGTSNPKDSIQTFIDDLKKEGFWNKLNIVENNP